MGDGDDRTLRCTGEAQGVGRAAGQGHGLGGGRLVDGHIAGLALVAKGGDVIMIRPVDKLVDDRAVFRGSRGNGLGFFAFAPGQGQGGVCRGQGKGHVVTARLQGDVLLDVGLADGDRAVLGRAVPFLIGNAIGVAAGLQAGDGVDTVLRRRQGFAVKRDAGGGGQDRQGDGIRRIRILPFEHGEAAGVGGKAAAQGRGQGLQLADGLGFAVRIGRAAGIEVVAVFDRRGAVAEEGFFAAGDGACVVAVPHGSAGAALADDAADVKGRIDRAEVVAVGQGALGQIADEAAEVAVVRVAVAANEAGAVDAEGDRAAALADDAADAGILLGILRDGGAFIAAGLDGAAICADDAAKLLCARHSGVPHGDAGDEASVRADGQADGLLGAEAGICQREIRNARTGCGIAEQAVAGAIGRLDVQAADGVARAVKATGVGVGRRADGRPGVVGVALGVEIQIGCQNGVVAGIPRIHLLGEPGQVLGGGDLVDAITQDRLCRRAVPGDKGLQGDGLGGVGIRHGDGAGDLFVAGGGNQIGILPGGDAIGPVGFRRHGRILAVFQRDGRDGLRRQACIGEGNDVFCRFAQGIGDGQIRAGDGEGHVRRALVAEEAGAVGIRAVRQDVAAVGRRRQRLARGIFHRQGRALGQLRERDAPDLRPDGVEVQIGVIQRNRRAVRVGDLAAVRAGGPAVEAVALSGEGVGRQVAGAENALGCRRVRAVVGVEDDAVGQGDGEVLEVDAVVVAGTGDILDVFQRQSIARRQLDAVGLEFRHIAAEIGLLRKAVIQSRAVLADAEEVEFRLRGGFVGERQLRGLGKGQGQCRGGAIDAGVRRDEGGAVVRHGEGVVRRAGPGAIGHGGDAVQGGEEGINAGGLRRGLHDGDGVDARLDLLGAAVAAAIVHGGPVGVADDDLQAVTHRDGDRLAGTVAGFCRVIRRSMIGLDLEVLVIGCRGHDQIRSRDALAQGQLIGLAAGGKLRAQGPAGDLQAGQGLGRVLGDAADIRPTIHGIAHVDGIPAAQVIARNSIIPHPLIGKPVVQGEHPTCCIAGRICPQAIDLGNIGLLCTGQGVISLCQCRLQAGDCRRAAGELHRFIHQDTGPGGRTADPAAGVGFLAGVVFHNDPHGADGVRRAVCRKYGQRQQAQEHRQRQKEAANSFTHRLFPFWIFLSDRQAAACAASLLSFFYDSLQIPG